MVGLKGKDKEVLSGLKTESRNPRTLDLDLMSVGELLTVMNEEDKNVIEAVKQVLPQVRETVEAVIRALNQGGRLVYAGAGTSGRLGILDAVECLPTFSTTDEVVGIIAGGEKAFVRAQEGAEDSKEEARKDLEHLKVDERDGVVALSAAAPRTALAHWNMPGRQARAAWGFPATARQSFRRIRILPSRWTLVRKSSQDPPGLRRARQRR